MSIVAITKALEVALNSMMPPISTAWSNLPFEPVTGVAYQYADILSETENPTQGSDYYREIGFLQLTLMYPLEQGSLPSNQRIELIRSTFKRGETFTADGITVHISETPSRDVGVADSDRYKSIVRIPFFANVCG